MDSFVFYRSFKDTVDYFQGGERQECLYYVVECLLGDRDPHSVPYPYGAAIIQMLASVNAAKERHEKAIEDGAKGGRPTKQEYIPPEEWQAYRKDHTQEETAQHFGITLRTLQNWERKIREDEKTRKNLNVNVNDNDNDNANDNVNVIISSNKETGSNGETSKVPVLPELKPGEEWTSEPMRVRNTGQWAAYYKTADGEERCMVFGEPV